MWGAALSLEDNSAQSEVDTHVWSWAHQTPLTALLFHEKVSTDVKQCFTRGLSHFCRKRLRVVMLERIRSSWKRAGGLGSDNGAMLHEVKKVSSSSSSSPRAADDFCPAACWGCSAACVNVTFHTWRTTSKKPRHPKCPKGSWASSFPSGSFSLSYLPIVSLSYLPSIQLPRNKDFFLSLSFAMGFFSCQRVKSERAWVPHQLAYRTEMAFALEFGSSPKW